MTKRIPAIPTKYNGITFRSKLEAKYAKAFDSLNIPWIYENVGFEFDDGTCYCPDFYLPDTGQYFEVKGLMTDIDLLKIHKLAESGENVIVGDSQGNLDYYVYGESWLGGSHVSKLKTYLARCHSCGHLYFQGEEGGWVCEHCNEYDGDARDVLYTNELPFSQRSFFDLVQWK